MTHDTTLPTPIKIDSRICFAIHWFSTETDALTYAAYIRKRGDRYNGGFYDGMPCGRDTTFDIRDDSGTTTHYAVTTA